jgi:hypothetical protein
MRGSEVTGTHGLPCDLLPIQNVLKYRTRENVGGIFHY